MKKLFTTVLGFCLAAAAADLKFDYKFETPSMIDGKPVIRDCERIMQPFVPDLPVKPVRLLLPDGYIAQSVEIEYGDNQTIELTEEVKPYLPSGRLSVTPPAGLSEKKSSVYQQDAYFPEQNKSLKYSVQYKNGHPVLLAIINPLRYNPISKTLLFNPKISLNIKLQADNSQQEMLKTDLLTQKRVAALVDNSAAVKGWQTAEYDTAYYDYLIITPVTYQNNFSNFINFNTRRCMETKIKTVESINSSVSGADLQTKIRTYIKQQYQQKKISFVLLVGDDEMIPHRGFRSQIMDYGTDYYNETDIPADMYYSCLDGTWQNLGSQYYGEPGSEDLLSEVYTARFAVDSSTELNNMLNKTIAYSENPVAAGVKKNLLVGELLWEAGDGPNFVDTYGKFYMDEFIGLNNHNSYSTVGFDLGWTNSTIYDYDAEWSGSELIQKVNTVKPVWIDHLGHSNVTYNLKLYSSQITSSSFPGTGSTANYFMIYSQGCYSGSFDNRDSYGSTGNADCIGEKFTTLSNAAFAYIGNSRYGLGSPYNTDGSGQRFHRYFHHALFGKNLHAIEEMNAFSKEINAPFILDQNMNNPPYYGQCRWIAYCVNVLGDPAVSLWTATPDSLDPIYPHYFGVTKDYFDLSTKPFSRYALLDKNGKFLYSGVTDSTGGGHLFLENSVVMNYMLAEDHGSLKLLVKADNYYPFTGDIQFSMSSIDGDLANKQFALNAYPNPFNSQTRIAYNLPADGNVRLEIYNSKGEMVASLLNEMQRAGQFSISWNASGMQSGLYFVSLKNGNKISRQKLLLVK